MAENNNNDNIIYVVDPDKRMENLKLLAQRIVKNIEKDDIIIFAQYLNEAIGKVMGEKNE